MCRSLVLAAALGVSLAFASAIDVAIGREAVQRALALGRGPEAARATFHNRFLFAIGDPTVTRVEVVTEFRRVVLAAEERVRLGDYLFSIRDAEGMLASWRGRFSLLAHLRFHPQNVLASVPAYEVVLGDAAGSSVTEPIEIRRMALHTLPPTTIPGLSLPAPAVQPAGSGTPILGAVIEAAFAAAPVAQATRPVIVRLDKKELARVTIDFSRIE